MKRFTLDSLNPFEKKSKPVRKGNWTILYPSSSGKRKNVKLIRGKPNKRHESFGGWAEEGFKNLTDVKFRLNWMNVPFAKRPKKVR